MASQLPVIATNVGGVSDLIKNEYNGILIERNNVQDLSHAIIQLARNGDLRLFLATNARKSVIENNSVQQACKTFALLFATGKYELKTGSVQEPVIEKLTK
jgi:glycosyltransferase involved in cell wall biosynthesis